MKSTTQQGLWGIGLLALAILAVTVSWMLFFGGSGAATLQIPASSTPTLQNQEHPVVVPPTAVLPTIPPAPGVAARPEPGRQDQP
jgi:hypothetical protein